MGIGAVGIPRAASPSPSIKRVRCPAASPCSESQTHPCCGAWASGSTGLSLHPTCDMEQLCWARLSQMAERRLLGAVRRPKYGVSEGILMMSQAVSPGGLPSRLCPSLFANSCPCLLLSSLRHLRPLQLHNHPPCEHRGWRVDDVSDHVCPAWEGWGLVDFWPPCKSSLPSCPPCSVFLILIRARAGEHPPRPISGVGPRPQTFAERLQSQTLRAPSPLPWAWPLGAPGPSGPADHCIGRMISDSCSQVLGSGDPAGREASCSGHRWSRSEVVWDRALECPR